MSDTPGRLSSSCPCSSSGRAGPAPSWPTAWASRPAPSVATSTGCGGSATPWTPSRGRPAATASASGPRSPRCCSTTTRRRRSPSRSACRPAAPCRASRNRPSPHWPSSTGCCRPTSGRGSTRSRTTTLPLGGADRVAAEVLVAVARAAAEEEARPPHLRRSRRPRVATTGRSVPADLHRPALVPRGLRCRPGRLAHVPRRPHRPGPDGPGTASSSSTRPTRSIWSAGPPACRPTGTRRGSSCTPRTRRSRRGSRPRSASWSRTPTARCSPWAGTS